MMIRKTARSKQRPKAAQAGARQISTRAPVAIEEARRVGLLVGNKSARLSFRAPRALVEAAKRESGMRSVTDLGILALATIAQRDPAATFLKYTAGRLGPNHTLSY